MFLEFSCENSGSHITFNFTLNETTVNILQPNNLTDYNIIFKSKTNTTTFMMETIKNKVHNVAGHTPESQPQSQFYKAAGKLAGKKALITGGDSGIGRAVAILFAMEGADVAIAYLPAEEEDAQHTKAQVEKNGGHIHLFQTDLTHANNCKDLVQKAVDALGGLNILVNNAAYQETKKDIDDTNE